MTPAYFELETKLIAEPSSLTAAQGLLYLYQHSLYLSLR